MVALLLALVAPTAQAVPAAPKVGDCWQYTSYGDAVTPATSPAKKVSCTKPHNAVTTAIATIPASITSPWGDPEAASVAARLQCDYRGYTSQLALGLPMSRPLRVEGDYYVPSEQQWAAGQRWARCDTIIPDGKTLEAFPADLKAWAADAKASGRCYDLSPAKGGLVRRCDGTETWTAPLWVAVKGTAFPGRAALVRTATASCAPLAKRQRQWDASFPKAPNWAMGYRGVMCLVGPIKTSV